MRKITALLLILLATYSHSLSQAIRVAILDFDNISGIQKYDGLGKALSSMLISDIESNVSPKRMQLVERSQINKILKEQNLQKSASIDKNTSIKFGKLLGVSYLLIGDVFILDNTLIINARLTDASTGDIKFSKKQEGKINEWLTIKTQLGKNIAGTFSLPFTEPRIPDASITPAILTTYANAITENDNGNFEKAETLINTAKDFDPKFSYLDDLRDEMEKLKKIVAEQGKKIEVLESSGGRVINAKSFEELKNNMYNVLSTRKDKEKILTRMVNEFPGDLMKYFDKFFSNIFMFSGDSAYQKAFQLSSLDSIFSEFEKNNITDIQKEKQNIFYQVLYDFTGTALASKDVKGFTNSEFDHFSKLANRIITSAFTTDEEKLYAKNLLLNAIISHRSLKTEQDPGIKTSTVFARELQLNQIEILKAIRYPYVQQIELCRREGLKSIIYTQMIIDYLSVRNQSFQNVKNHISESDYMYTVNQRKNAEAVTASDPDEKNEILGYGYETLKESLIYFAVPSISGNQNAMEWKGNQYYAEMPASIQMNKETKNAIINYDSMSKRYIRIAAMLKEKKLDENQKPCYISQNIQSLIRQSDSIALKSEIYLLTSLWPPGTCIYIISNCNKDTAEGFVIGEQSSASKNKITIINNNLSVKLNINSLILFFYDKYNKKNIRDNDENDTQLEEINDAIQECKENSEEAESDSEDTDDETPKNNEKEREKEVARKKQRELFNMELSKDWQQYRDVQKGIIQFFSRSGYPIDTLLYNKIIDQYANKTISKDSVFSRGFTLLLKNENYNKESSQTADASSAQESLLLNLYLIYIHERYIKQVLNDPESIGSKEKYLHPYRSLSNAAKINLAHGYLLCAKNYQLNLYADAMKGYNSVPQQFLFSEDFNQVTRDEMIRIDWNDFIERKLITKEEIKAFNEKYKIISSF